MKIFLYNNKKSEEKRYSKMADIKLNLKNTEINKKNILEYSELIENIHKDLHKRAKCQNIINTAKAK